MDSITVYTEYDNFDMVVEELSILSKIPLTSQEKVKLSKELLKMVDYFTRLDAVNTEGVEPTYNVTNLKNISRSDTPTPSLTREQALKNASSTKNGLFITKGVLDE